MTFGYSRLLTQFSNPPLTNNSCTAPPSSPTFTSHLFPPPTRPSPADSSTVTLLFLTSHLTFHPVRRVNAASLPLYKARSFSTNDGTSRHKRVLLIELRLKISPNEPAMTKGIFRLCYQRNSAE